MFPFGIILPAGGVFVTDIVEENAGGGGGGNQSIKFFLDGTLGEAEAACGQSFTLYPGEWWRGSPALNIGNSFEVRVASVSSGVFDTEAAPVGDWIVIDDVCWGIQRTGGKDGEGSGTDQVIAIMEIRDIATETIRATFNIDLTATRL